MRRFLLVGGLSLLAMLLVQPATSAPDPTKNKNAIFVILDCGGSRSLPRESCRAVPGRFLGITGDRARSAGSTFGFDAWDNPERTGDPVSSFRQPGFFGTNQQQLTACDFTLPNFEGLWFTGYFMFTPRGG